MPLVLHVEDDDAVAVAFRSATDEAHIPVKIDRMSDGEQDLEYLRAQGCFAAVERPDLVFLDLNLPGVDGWQVLAEMH